MSINKKTNNAGVSAQVLPEYKVVVAGSGGVGKTALIIQFISKYFTNGHNPVPGDRYVKQMEVDGQLSLFDVVDTAGQEDHSVMREYYMTRGDGFLVVYSVTDKQSFDDLRNFYTEILRFKKRDACPMMLVANKVDLVNLREVTEEEGKQLSVKLKIPYIEMSVKDPPVNVDSAFRKIARIIQSFRETEAELRKREEKKCDLM